MLNRPATSPSPSPTTSERSRSRSRLRQRPRADSSPGCRRRRFHPTFIFTVQCYSWLPLPQGQGAPESARPRRHRRECVATNECLNAMTRRSGSTGTPELRLQDSTLASAQQRSPVTRPLSRWHRTSLDLRFGALPNTACSRLSSDRNSPPMRSYSTRTAKSEKVQRTSLSTLPSSQTRIETSAASAMNPTLFSSACPFCPA